MGKKTLASIGVPGGEFTTFEVEERPLEPKKEYRPKRVNTSTLSSSARQNHLGLPYLDVLERERIAADMIKNPRKYRCEGTGIFD